MYHKSNALQRILVKLIVIIEMKSNNFTRIYNSISRRHELSDEKILKVNKKTIELSLLVIYVR